MLLELRQVCKQYNNGNVVIRDLNADLPEGRILGLLGPNGCGKTTLIKMISGLLPVTSGSIRIDGRLPGPDSAGIISYLPERPYFDPVMKASELLDYFSDFYPDFHRDTAERLLSDLKIDPKSRMKTLSKGNREKVQLALVMSRQARLYLLDEPIAGVDPASRDYILETIVGQYNRGASVVISTHLIRDVETILDEFVFMGYGGAVMAAGDVRETRAREGRSLDELFREVFSYVPQSF
ncbi:MAG: ABC transporter ATP-binding protein [Clostridia bacterium]|nr:ABC transporter ATP-binding protein [Clostridia bacterium]